MGDSAHEVGTTEEDFFRTSLFDGSDVRRIKHCRNSRGNGDVTLYQDGEPIIRGRNCNIQNDVVFMPWSVDNPEFRGLSAGYGVHPPVPVDKIPEDIEEDGTHEHEDGRVNRYFKVWKLVKPPEVPWNFHVDNKGYLRHCVLAPLQNVTLTDVTCDNGVLSGNVPLDFEFTGAYSMRASADPELLPSDKGIGRIVMLLRELIRLADCADDCVTANAICDRIEQEARPASSNDLALTLEEQPVVRELLRCLVVLADSYDLALAASAAVENLILCHRVFRKSEH